MPDIFAYVIIFALGCAVGYAIRDYLSRSATDADAGSDSGVNRSIRSPRKSAPKKDSDPTLRGHPRAPSPGLREKSAFPQPINYNGRRVAISEESKITQDSQIAPLQIALHP
jgi:hypothetical protein